MTHLRIAAFAAAFGAALGAANAAHATFVIDTSCGHSKCDAGTDFFIDTANSDVSTFGGTVQGRTQSPSIRLGTLIQGLASQRSNQSKAAPSPI